MKIHGNRLYQFTTRNSMLNSPHAGQEKRNRGRNTVNASVDKIKLQIFTDCFERSKDRRKIYHCFYPISRRRSLYGKKGLKALKAQIKSISLLERIRCVP